MTEPQTIPVSDLAGAHLGVTVSLVHDGVLVIGALHSVQHQLDHRGTLGRSCLVVATDRWRWIKHVDAATEVTLNALQVGP